MDPVIAQVAAALAFAVRVASAMMLAGAGVAKLAAPDRFLDAVSDYRIVPPRMVPIVAALLPPVEIVLGTLLLPDITNPLPEVLAALLLLIFAASIAINLLRGRMTIDCGCSLTRNGQPIHPALVFRNLSIAAALLAATRAPFPELMILPIATCAGALLFFLLVISNRVVALAGRAATHR